MKRVLITGANGFIGRHLVEALRGRADVYALDKRVRQATGDEHLRWIEHDLTEPLVGLGIPAPLDSVVHLAQSSEYRNFPEKADDIFRVNVLGTFQVLEYARGAGARSFVFASTGTVYTPSNSAIPETAPVKPEGFYAVTKYVSELMISEYKAFFPCVTVRFFGVYGPRQVNALIPNLMKKVLAGETITIDGDPGLRLNPLHVRDAVRVLQAAIDLRQSELLNAAGDEPVSITDLVRLIEQEVGRPATIRYQETHRVGDLVGDNARMKEVLGIHPKVSLGQGIASLTTSVQAGTD